MKRHMAGWKVFFIVMGVLCLVGAAGSMLMVKFAAVGACVAAALTMFMTASVCAWMDDLLEAVNRPKERASAETARMSTETTWMSTEEKAMRARSEGSRRRIAKQEAAPTMSDMYHAARDSD